MEKLTDRRIKSMKPETEAYRIYEGKGFCIRVLPSGLRRFEYVYTIGGKKKVMSLGHYPSSDNDTTGIKLADARDAYTNAWQMVRKGIDPQVVPTEVKSPATSVSTTVADLVEKWMKWSAAHHSPKWANTLKLTLEKDFLPRYGNRLAIDIKRMDAANILKEKAKTAPGQARNLHKALRGTWEYGVDEELVEFNPFAELKTTKRIPSMKQIARKRVLTDNEIIAIWQSAS